MARKVLRSDLNVFLVGPVKENFSALRIPTNRETLQVYFYFRLVEKLSAKESLTATTKKVVSLSVADLNRSDHIKRVINRLYVTWRCMYLHVNCC